MHVKSNVDAIEQILQIQKHFFSDLSRACDVVQARKALCALRGLVKLQALIRGHLVRKQARATLRRMQALLMAQTRLRAQRMRMLEDEDP
jgi:hypothetical protein